MVQAIAKEAELRKDYISEPIETIYFGGGTPSLLSDEHLKYLLHTFYSLFDIKDEVEITLETNPDDIDKNKLALWKNLGINRLSIGIQSFFDDDLQWMNRAHNAKQALESIKIAQDIGFENMTIDLIYGTPLLTDEQWIRNIETAISLSTPHLSCYALTVEPKTALQKLIAQGKMQNVDVDKQSRHFEILMEYTKQVGYEHYEISNFAKIGYRSKHNSSYWQGKSYIGLGPSAHSFNGTSRQWNIANNTVYIQSIQEDIVPFEIEILTPIEQLNEYLMLGLRTLEGIMLNVIEERWGSEMRNNIVKDAKNYFDNNFLLLENDRLFLSGKGKLFADRIASELFRGETK